MGRGGGGERNGALSGGVGKRREEQRDLICCLCFAADHEKHALAHMGSRPEWRKRPSLFSAR